MPNWPLIHLHIPKNGGVTLGRTIAFELLRRRPGRLLHPSTCLGRFHVSRDERPRAIANLPPHRQAKVRLFSAHRGFGVHEAMGIGQPTYLTMVRDPVKRTLSAYDYFHDKPAGISMDRFIIWIGSLGLPRRRPVYYLDNAQVRYLGAKQGQIIDVPVGEVTPAMLARAKQRIDREIDATLILERYDESILLLRHLMGWSGCYCVPANVNRRRSLTEPDPATRQVIEDYNRLDIDLYAHACERFNQQLAEIGDVDAKLAAYRQANRRYGRAFRPLYAALDGYLKCVRKTMRLRRPNS